MGYPKSALRQQWLALTRSSHDQQTYVRLSARVGSIEANPPVRVSMSSKASVGIDGCSRITGHSEKGI